MRLGEETEAAVIAVIQHLRAWLARQGIDPKPIGVTITVPDQRTADVIEYALKNDAAFGTYWRPAEPEPDCMARICGMPLRIEVPRP